MKWFCNYFVQVIRVTSFCCSPLHNDCTAQGSLHCANVSRSSAPAPPPALLAPCPVPPCHTAPLPCPPALQLQIPRKSESGIATWQIFWRRGGDYQINNKARRNLSQRGAADRQAGSGEVIWHGNSQYCDHVDKLQTQTLSFWANNSRHILSWIINSLFVTTFIASPYSGIQQGKLSLNVTWDYIPGIGSHLRCVYLIRGPSLPYIHRPFRPKS